MRVSRGEARSPDGDDRVEWQGSEKWFVPVAKSGDGSDEGVDGGGSGESGGGSSLLQEVGEEDEDEGEDDELPISQIVKRESSSPVVFAKSVAHFDTIKTSARCFVRSDAKKIIPKAPFSPPKKLK